MFCFVNLGTVLTYGAATLALGGGGYTAWCFRDAALTSVVSAKNITTQSKNTISEKFTQQLEHATHHQQELAQDEAEIEKLAETIGKSTQELEELSKTIRDLKTEITNWESKVIESSEKLKLLQKDKDAKTTLVESLEQAFNDQKLVVGNYDTTAINKTVDRAQQDLQNSDESKAKTEQDFNANNVEICKLTDIIAKSTKLLQELNSKKSKTEQDIDKKVKEIKTTEDSKDEKIRNIKTQINNHISTISSRINALNVSIAQLNTDISTIQQEIMCFDSELTKVNSLKKPNGQPLNNVEKQQKRTEINNKKSTKTSSLRIKTTQKDSENEEKTQKEVEKRQLQEQNNDLSSAKELTTSNTGLKASIASTISEVQRLDQSVTKLNSDKNQLTGEKDYLESQIEKITKSNSDTESQKSTLVAKVADLSDKKTEAQNDYKSKQQALLTVQTKQIEELKNIGESTMDLSKKESSLLAAKSDLAAIIKDVSDVDKKWQELEVQRTSLKNKLLIEEKNYTNQVSELTSQKQQKIEKEKAYELKKQT